MQEEENNLDIIIKVLISLCFFLDNQNFKTNHLLIVQNSKYQNKEKNKVVRKLKTS